MQFVHVHVHVHFASVPIAPLWLIKFKAVVARSLTGQIDVYYRICRYKVRLYDAQAYGIKKSVYNGTAMAFMWFIIYAVYALAFWYGAKLTRDEPNNYSAGDVLIVSCCVMLCPRISFR